MTNQFYEQEQTYLTPAEPSITLERLYNHIQKLKDKKYDLLNEIDCLDELGADTEELELDLADVDDELSLLL